MTVYLTIAALLILLILIGQSKLTIDTKFLKDGNDDEIVVKVTAFRGLLKYKVEVPMIDVVGNEQMKPALQVSTEVEAGKNEAFIGDNEEIFNTEEIKKFLDRFQHLYRQYKSIGIYLKNKMIVSKFSWETNIGLDDAANTAIAVGGLWIIKAGFISFLKNFMNTKKIHLNIQPIYQGFVLKTRLESIIQVKIGYIITAGIKFLVVYLKDGDKR